MVDYWGIYNGKTREELNPHGLREGDWVIAPDGVIGQLERPGFKWGFLQGRDRPYALMELRPAYSIIITS
ncbi:MAG: hypothetical protein WBA57_02525 [Elainellaceae cyanobacterium]